MIINENKKLRLKTKNKYCTDDIDIIVDVPETDNPYIATTATEMAQYLASKYYGSVVKYTGTTGTYTQNMLYKVKAVSSSEWAFDELITPVGSTTITENNTYDVKEYAEVVVNVPIGITPTGNINITDTNTTDVTNYATAKVVDSNLVANNIKKDTTILGVTGTLESGITPTGSIDITSNGTVDVTNYASANVNVPSITEVATADEMNALLIEANVGKVYRFVGTTDETYTNGDLYEVVSE